ncbi:helix-turn-helix domain-containing protein [Streptomyces sp. NPDC002206]
MGAGSIHAPVPGVACADRAGLCRGGAGRLPRSGSSVAREFGVTTEPRARFVTHRLDGLGDAPRPGRARTVTDEQVAELVRLTLETRPKNATHWSSPATADASTAQVTMAGSTTVDAIGGVRGAGQMVRVGQGTSVSTAAV